EGVQKELKMTEDQIKKLGTLGRDMFTKFRDKFMDAGMDMEKRAAVLKEMETETNKVIADTLKPEQVKRLKQIALQVGGFRELAKEEVQKELKCTAKQKEEIDTLSKEIQKDTQDLLRDARGDQEKMAKAREKIQEMNKKALEKFAGTLSDDQKKTWKEMTGEK